MISRLESDQIKYCRIICIFFMMMVHLPPGFSDAPLMPEYLSVIVVIFVDVLGKASVSALSLISGFLIVASLRKASWGQLVRNRFNTLILPMAFWNVMIILFGYLVLLGTGERIAIIDDLMGLRFSEILASKIFALQYGAASESLNFLRDIFVCVSLSPIILFLASRLGWWLLPLLLLIDATVSFQPVIMRGPIVIFFAAGVVMAHNFNSLNSLRKFWVPSIVAILVVCGFEMAKILSTQTIYDFPGYGLLKRLCLTLFVINLAYTIASSAKSRLVDVVDPATYFVFLSHNVAFAFLWGGWQLFFGRDLDFPYVIYFMLAPLVWYVCGVFVCRGVYRMPRAAQIIVAGKVGAPKYLR